MSEEKSDFCFASDLSSESGLQTARKNAKARRRGGDAKEDGEREGDDRKPLARFPSSRIPRVFAPLRFGRIGLALKAIAEADGLGAGFFLFSRGGQDADTRVAFADELHQAPGVAFEVFVGFGQVEPFA